MALRFIRQAKARSGSPLRNWQTSTMAAGCTGTQASLLAGAIAPTRSPNFAASRWWISSNVMSGGHLVVDAQAGRALADLLALAEPALADDLVLHAEQALGERFGPGRAARDVDVHGDQLVHALADRIRVLEEAAAGGAGAHRDHVLGLRHLLEEQPAALRHLVGQRPGHDHQVALPGRRARDRSEAVDVRPRPAGLHQLDAA